MRLARLSRLRALAALGACALSAAPALCAGAPEFEAHVTAKRWVEAEALAAEIVRQQPENPEAAADLARVIILSRQHARFAEAAALLERAIAAQPDVARHHFFLGRACGRLAQEAGLGGLGLAKKARTALQRAAELESQNFEYAFALNEFYLEAPFIAGGGVGKARQAAQAFRKIDAGCGALLQAQTAIREREFDAALKLLESVPARGEALIDATRRLLLLRVGAGFFDDGRAPTALQLFTSLNDEYPDDAAVLLGLGRGRLESGDAPGAISALARAAELGGGAEAHYQLGLAYQETGDNAAACGAFRACLERQSTGREADDARRRLAALER